MEERSVEKGEMFVRRDRLICKELRRLLSQGAATQAVRVGCPDSSQVVDVLLQDFGTEHMVRGCVEL